MLFVCMIINFGTICTFSGRINTIIKETKEETDDLIVIAI